MVPGSSYSRCPRCSGSRRRPRRHDPVMDAELRPPAGSPCQSYPPSCWSPGCTPRPFELAFARATRPSTLVALTVRSNPIETAALEQEWIERDIPVPLVTLDSPYRDSPDLALDYIRQIRRRAHATSSRVRARVRRRPLVGTTAAQSSAHCGSKPDAVPARRDAHQRALAARLRRGAQLGAPCHAEHGSKRASAGAELS